MITAAIGKKVNCGDGITAGNLRELVRKQGHRCAITVRELSPGTAAMDHIMPISRGGAHDLSNVWIVHMEVNRAKGVMTYDEFLAMCREVVAFADGVGICELPQSGGGSFPPEFSA